MMILMTPKWRNSCWNTNSPDQHLALGLDLLTRDVDPQLGQLGFVDYKSLGVRQLGSIYEGLLGIQSAYCTGKNGRGQGHPG
jgi:hypothetical protein